VNKSSKEVEEGGDEYVEIKNRELLEPRALVESLHQLLSVDHIQNQFKSLSCITRALSTSANVSAS
jgi:hypothetical protein